MLLLLLQDDEDKKKEAGRRKTMLQGGGAFFIGERGTIDIANAQPPAPQHLRPRQRPRPLLLSAASSLYTCNPFLRQNLADRACRRARWLTFAQSKCDPPQMCEVERDRVFFAAFLDSSAEKLWSIAVQVY